MSSATRVIDSIDLPEKPSQHKPARAGAPTRPNWMELDLTALDNNFAIVRSLLKPGVRLHASVKSAAYGFDLPEVAKRLVGLGAEALSCGSFEDARAIRECGLHDVEIVMFGGTLPAGIPDYLELGLIPTVHNMELAEAVSECARSQAKIYIKVDAGWGRLGFPIKTAKDSILKIAAMPNVVLEGVYTHLPFTDAQGVKSAQERTMLFDELIADLRREGLEIPVTQARSSSGVLVGIVEYLQLGGARKRALRQTVDFPRSWRRLKVSSRSSCPCAPASFTLRQLPPTRRPACSGATPTR